MSGGTKGKRGMSRVTVAFGLTVVVILIIFAIFLFYGKGNSAATVGTLGSSQNQNGTAVNEKPMIVMELEPSTQFTKAIANRSDTPCDGESNDISKNVCRAVFWTSQKNDSYCNSLASSSVEVPYTFYRVNGIENVTIPIADVCWNLLASNRGYTYCNNTISSGAKEICGKNVVYAREKGK